MKTTLSSNGRLVLPVKLRKRDGIRPGQQFSIERIDAGQYLLKKVPATGHESLVEWLVACPEKGWFETLESESTEAFGPDKRFQ